ncbi:phosphopantetheine-binding protein [Corynebacterium matruchotii]|uniref:phosphopantetheine-binding protein n=1 Tax=Corynebacterium matruchotii TaxID=43768 RepID=UPI003C701B8A
MTETKIITDVAESLGVAPDTLTPDTNLADTGLDSLRLIMLVEKWRAEGVTVDFQDILTRATLAEWFELFQS